MDRSIRFKQEGTKVLMILNGVLLAEWDYEKALEVANALKGVAKIAEANNPRVMDAQVMDQAMIIRSGFMPGLSLTQDPRVFKEAFKEAQHDRTLRRNMKEPGLGKINVKWGLPKIIKKAPA